MFRSFSDLLLLVLVFMLFLTFTYLAQAFWEHVSTAYVRCAVCVSSLVFGPSWSFLELVPTFLGVSAILQFTFSETRLSFAGAVGIVSDILESFQTS